MGWKMVRDRAEEAARPEGVSGIWREEDRSEEVIRALGRKLIEESSEFIENYDPEELYDLQDVLQELIWLLDAHGKAGAKHDRKVRQQGRFRNHVMWSPNPNEQWR